MNQDKEFYELGEKMFNHMNPPGTPDDDARHLVDRYKREAEVYAVERDHAKACYDRAVRLLTGIHALLYPPRFTDNDGRTWEFRLPIAQEQMQELSDRIRALPDEIEKTDAAKLKEKNT